MKVIHPNPSVVVVAVAALCLGLGGGVGYAAGALPHNSVGAKQLKKNAVTTKKIKNHAVTGAKVAPDSLTGAEINESTLALPSKAGVLSLSAYDFVGRGTDVTWSSTGVGEVQTTSAADGLVAPIHLPAGATITAIKVFVEDGHPAAEITASVTRYTPATKGFELLPVGGVKSVGSTTDVQTLNLPVVQPASGTVVAIQVGLPNVSSLKLWGAEVDYTA